VEFEQVGGPLFVVRGNCDWEARWPLSLAKEFGLPIRLVGIGEKAEDLREFDPEAFVDALLPEALGG